MNGKQPAKPEFSKLNALLEGDPGLKSAFEFAKAGAGLVAAERPRRQIRMPYVSSPALVERTGK